MSFAGDARVILSLLRGVRGGGSHAERLQQFYGPQSGHYDDFRERLLAGRRELIDMLPAGRGSRVIEVGGGTGRNLDFFGPRLSGFQSVEIVDLCPALLEVARARTAGLTNVRIVHADATTYRPSAPVDCVFFSYALTMIPDWYQAIDNAIAMLRPGGTLAVVDFYVSRPHPDPGLVRHGAMTRTLWPLWFRHDGVCLSQDHLPYLRARLETIQLHERRSPLPYLPWMKVPYYLFLGRNRAIQGNYHEATKKDKAGK